MEKGTDPGALQRAYNAKGKPVSPQFPEHIKNFLIDIDGTICEDIPNEEPERMRSAEPFSDARRIINKWYDQGHRITFFTSRTEEHRELTEEWLKKHGFRYNAMITGKPRGGNYHWIDSQVVRATRYRGKFTDLVRRKHEIEVFEP